MLTGSCSRLRLCHGAIRVLVVIAVGTTAARAQTWTVDPRTSLAWWQLSPHLGHLWATTCPQDPSWQPGESRGAGHQLDQTTRKEVPIIQVDDPRVPLYPRERVAPVCSEAVSGSVAVADSARWAGVRGVVIVRTEHLINGMPMRDAFARKAVYSSERYPDVRFLIDSLADVRRGGGDTLHAKAVGAMVLRGVRTQLTVPVEAWADVGGLRVRGKFSIPARELVSVYGVSSFALGLSLGTRIWKTLHLGFDVVLRPPGGPA
jgi:hypothetical protein